jgi:hypothetical protein
MIDAQGRVMHGPERTTFRQRVTSSERLFRAGQLDVERQGLAGDGHARSKNAKVILPIACSRRSMRHRQWRRHSRATVSRDHRRHRKADRTGVERSHIRSAS